MPGEAALKTALFDWHKAHGGRMVEFGGWLMPVQYSTITEEHAAVRQRAGLFDISHMGRLRFAGPGTLEWLQRVTTNDVAKLVPGQIQYSLMVNDAGGVLDDVLVYHLSEGFAMVCNASNRLAVMRELVAYLGKANATFVDRTPQTAMIAVQGPKAREILAKVCSADLGAIAYYHTTEGTVTGADGKATPAAISRTGYTGEDGFEVIVPNEVAVAVWEALLEAGKPFQILPCGLGARDTLRFEAAMPLYGHELTESINPYEAGLGWAVKLQKGEFIGREALKKAKQSLDRKRVGLALTGKRIARQDCVVKQDGQEVGFVTSGTFSPTLGKSLAMALVAKVAAAEGTRLHVDVRGNDEPAEVVPLPFYHRAGE